MDINIVVLSVFASEEGGIVKFSCNKFVSLAKFDLVLHILLQLSPRDNHCATPHTRVAAVADEFDCQKQTMPNSGMKQILNIFSLVPCTQLETENFNLKTNKNMSHYSLLLVPFATTIGSWKNAT